MEYAPPAGAETNEEQDVLERHAHREEAVHPLGHPLDVAGHERRHEGGNEQEQVDGADQVRNW
jgi:hypothetical protein